MAMLFEVVNHVGYIRFNRPERRNSFTLAMMVQMAELLDQAAASPEVRAVVISGVGRSFCAGVDLDELEATGNGPVQMHLALQDLVHPVAKRINECPKPVLAAVNGPAYGAGMDMVLMCDLAFASESATFAESYIRAGLVPGDGGCWLLPRVVGEARALDLLWTGRTLKAIEAKDLGIVLEVVDDASLNGVTAAYAERLAASPPLAVEAIKRLVRSSSECSFATGLQMAATATAVIRSSEDSALALEALRSGTSSTYRGA